jgi:protein-S-isoprenylcysteine O-methyltransferase Ste14
MLTLFFLNADPALITRRLRAGPTAERRPMQRRIQTLVTLLFLGLILLPGFDHRFGWSDLPPSAALAGDALIVLGYLLIFFVFRANSFAGSIIETVADQRVIESGPYGIVRHPMYSGALLLAVGIPLALGSQVTLPLCLPMAVALAWRAADEERCLLAELAGYADYRRRIRWRLVPGIY